jgi:chemotaxis protein CheC
MSEVRGLRAVELDALRETANIGAGHAATALSQMTNRTIMITVPQVHVRPLEAVGTLLGRADDPVAAIQMQVMGDVTGRTLVVLPEPSARVLCDLVFRRPFGATTTFETMEQSGLKEVGNIVVSAYLTALSDFLGLMLLPSVPTLAFDAMGAVLTGTSLDLDSDHDYVISVETAFSVAGAAEALRGHFLLLPDAPSLRAVFDAIRLP